MTPEPLHRIIQSILNQLDDTLDDLRIKLIALLEEIERHPQRVPILRAQLIQLLRTHPGLLQQAIDLLRASTLGGGHREPTKGTQESTLSSPTQPDTVTRYTDIACPRRIWAQTPRVTVVVRLTRTPSALSPDVQEMALRTDTPVWVRISAPAFRVLGEAQKPLIILAEADSETSFDLQPLGMVGQANIRFDFVQGGNPVGAASVTVEIVAEEVPASVERTAAQLMRWQPGAPPPDLMLHVAHEHLSGQPHLLLTLYEEGASVGRTFAPVPLPGNPQSLTETLYQRLTYLTEQAAKGHTRLSTADIEREVHNIGQNLWLEVIPHEFKMRYAEMRERWANRPLLLITDEPYIPWELVWPYERMWQDEAPWGVRLRLTRWLRRGKSGGDYESPPAFLTLNALALVMPGSSFLAALPHEQAHLAQLMAQHGIADCSPPTPDLGSVLTLLQAGGYQWLHVSTHGLFAATDPNDAATLQLDGEHYLTPNDFVGSQIANHLWQQRPGFVFNACHGGRQGWALTRMGGWADRLLGLGAGLFIAPLWAVGDSQALAFSQGFYDALLEPKTVAEAVYAGRLKAYRAGDPTWLAYSVYAHPNAQVAQR